MSLPETVGSGVAMPVDTGCAHAGIHADNAKPPPASEAPRIKSRRVNTGLMSSPLFKIRRKAQRTPYAPYSLRLTHDLGGPLINPPIFPRAGFESCTGAYRQPCH